MGKGAAWDTTGCTEFQGSGDENLDVHANIHLRRVPGNSYYACSMFTLMLHLLSGTRNATKFMKGKYRE